MTEGTSGSAPTAWIGFLAMTVVCWGLYGILLHRGQVQMADPVGGRYKAFLFVGVAYVLVAVVGPIAMLLTQKAAWTFTSGGLIWSTIAGVVGAVGAFGVLLAFGHGGQPAVVMSLVFAGAPVVNAVVAVSLAGAWGRVPWPFFAGVLMAAGGAWLVVSFKPH